MEMLFEDCVVSMAPVELVEKSSVCDTRRYPDSAAKGQYNK